MECAICKSKDDEPVFFCDCCQRPTHRYCTGLSATEIKVLDLKGKRLLRFYCEECQNGLRLIPKLLTKIDKLEEEVNQLKKSMEHAGDRAMLTLTEREDLIGEIVDRQSRASNIIVFNVNESKRKSHSERSSEDTCTVKDILENFDIDKEKIKSFRLGKYSPLKTIPIKVVLSSPENVKLILKNRDLIKGSSVRVYMDQTKAQRDYFRGLKDELQLLRDKGDHSKTIKFVNGKPTVVNVLVSNSGKN